MSEKDLSCDTIHIVGGGLAGSEAAWQIAQAGLKAHLYEMRPVRDTKAHVSEDCAELVCSNSFRSDDHEMNAVGLLHEEMRRCDSMIMASADAHQVPAGAALAVDRGAFSKHVTQVLKQHPNITLSREEITQVTDKNWAQTIIATGPLTSSALADHIALLTDKDSLAFFDAIAPIIHKDSINMDVCWFQSRYDKPGPSGTGADYINCPLNKAQYTDFITQLLAADVTEFKSFEKDTPYFDGCLPIEVMAARGTETLRFGPMKPVGLTNPHHPDEAPYAVVQLRQDNKLGTLWNMVGFQTKLKYGAQADIFRLIPGLKEAQFARLGGMHRNTFLNSPELLTNSFQLKSRPNLRFAGQITGVEGYVESAACGLMAGRFAVADLLGQQPQLPSQTTALGALRAHVTGGHLIDQNGGARSFQPMNINFGLFPPVTITKPEGVKRWRGKDKASAKKRALTARALNDITSWAKPATKINAA